MPDKPLRPTGPAATPAPPHAHEPPTGNSASTLIEAPLPPGRKNPLDPHEFADGGGSGGAEAFRRRPR
jgi:hypothetical protein